MSFSGTDYLPFLGFCLLVFPFLPRAARPAGMLGLSYAFYLAHTPWHLGVLVASTALDYFVGLSLGKAEGRGLRRALLGVSIAGNLALLGVFKYRSDTVLALGISFYTFQSLSYSIDVFRRRLKPCRDPIEFGLFVAFFPQLIAGPIERAGRLMPQLAALDVPSKGDLSIGVRLILWGLWKKLCLSDRLRPELTANLYDPSGMDPLAITMMAVGLNLVLYLDFSGYTDIARGSARLFGVTLSKNFQRPYLATSVGDFTRRWHVTLIEWITDYVWAPLLKGRPKALRLGAVNVLVILIFALWHDLRWGYAIASVFVGLAITREQLARMKRLRSGKGRAKPGAGGVLIAWLSTVLIWSAFTTTLFMPALDGIQALILEFGRLNPVGIDTLKTLAGALPLVAVGFAAHASGKYRDLEADWDRLPAPLRPLILVVAALVIARYQAAGTQDFVYFRF